MTPNYRSKFEQAVGELLGSFAKHEPEIIPYVQPSKKRRYLPDFKTKAGVYIEAKGKWTADDRQKHVLLREQHPDKRIVIVFMNANVKLSKRSKTTYGDWATAHGIEWYDWKAGLPKELYIESKPSNRNTRGRSPD